MTCAICIYTKVIVNHLYQSFVARHEEIERGRAVVFVSEGLDDFKVVEIGLAEFAVQLHIHFFRIEWIGKFIIQFDGIEGKFALLQFRKIPDQVIDLQVAAFHGGQLREARQGKQDGDKGCNDTFHRAADGSCFFCYEINMICFK